MCVLSIKVPIRKKSGNLFNDPRTFEKSMSPIIPPLTLVKLDQTELCNLSMATDLGEGKFLMETC